MTTRRTNPLFRLGVPCLASVLLAAAAATAGADPPASPPASPAPGGGAASAKAHGRPAAAAHAAAAPPRAAPPEERQAIQDAYNDADAAAQNKNAAGVLAHCAPDFVSVDEKGKGWTLAQTRVEVARTLLLAQTVENTTEVRSAMLQDGGAVVLVSEHENLSLKNPYTGRTIVVTAENACRDFWVKTDKGWVEKRTRVLSTQQNVEGGGVLVRRAPHW